MLCNWLSLIVKGVFGYGFSVLVSVPWFPWWLALLLIILEWQGVVAKIPPHMNVLPPWLLVCSMCSTVSDTLPDRFTIPVLHVLPKFNAVAVFCVITLLFQVVQGVFCWSQDSPQLRCVPTYLGLVSRVSAYLRSLWYVGWFNTTDALGNECLWLKSPKWSDIFMFWWPSPMHLHGEYVLMCPWDHVVHMGPDQLELCTLWWWNLRGPLHPSVGWCGNCTPPWPP